MVKREIVDYWIETSNSDFMTMKHLYESKDYNWCLFIGHLVIEKLLKALYVKTIDINTPKTHDLLYIAEKINLDLNDEQKEFFDLLTTFNISARYPDYKKSFYNKCTDEYTKKMMNKIMELREWLIKLLDQN